MLPASESAKLASLLNGVSPNMHAYQRLFEQEYLTLGTMCSQMVLKGGRSKGQRLRCISLLNGKGGRRGARRMKQQQD